LVRQRGRSPALTPFALSGRVVRFEPITATTLDLDLWPCLNVAMLLFGNSVFTSPYVLSCFVALREKGLAFEMKTVALDLGAQNDPTFAKQSLTSRVPMLVDGDFALSESSAIVEYLEDAYPAPGHPRVL